jgi:hypothetical protein
VRHSSGNTTPIRQLILLWVSSLNIVAKKKEVLLIGVTKQYTSARLNSKFAFKYGRIDVSKVPVKQVHGLQFGC